MSDDSKLAASIGERKEWRDTGAARLAAADTVALEKKKAVALEMLRNGVGMSEIIEQTKKQFGFGIGMGTIGRLRKQLEEAKVNKARSSALQLARASRWDTELNEKKATLALKMLRDGAGTRDIHDAVKASLGVTIGAGMLVKLRKQMRLENKREERRAKREAKQAAAPVAPAAQQSTALAVATVAPDGWVRLKAEPPVVLALLAAKAPFVFDGTHVSLKGG